MSRKPPTSARARSTNPRQTTTEVQTDRIIGPPAIGKSWAGFLADDDVRWPDTNSASLQIRSEKNGEHRRASFSFRATITTRLFALALTAVIAGYAMCRNDAALLRSVVSVIGQTAEH